MKRHKKCVHGGTKYQCDECGHEAPDIRNLKKHILANHLEGRKYFCDQCKFESERQCDLTRHNKEVHEGVKYQVKSSQVRKRVNKMIMLIIISIIISISINTQNTEYEIFL